jgi:hypothetical protein
MQYAFGGLFSGFVVLYLKSGSLLVSFPFILTLLALLISNEFIHRKAPWLTLQITILFIAYLSYATVITPVLLDQTGTLIFILGTIIALFFISIYIWVFTKILPKSLSQVKNNLKKAIAITFISFHFLYFTNIIPPIPLSLKDGGIFHSVTKQTNGDYVVKAEKSKWYKPFEDYNSTFHYVPGQTVYAFSAIFTPINKQETIYHKWLYFDDEKLRWVEVNNIPITITSGRDLGFRGYSEKSSIFPGKWRVDIENEKGQVISSLRFKLKKVASKPDVVERVY